MICPHCYEENIEGATECRFCGKNMEKPSTSLIAIPSRLPSKLHVPRVPRLAAGVGAVAVGVGLELLRRGLVARALRPARAVGDASPLVNLMRDALSPRDEKPTRLPKNYEIEETVVYMRRVIRRKN